MPAARAVGPDAGGVGAGAGERDPRQQGELDQGITAAKSDSASGSSMSQRPNTCKR
jgi:hypothetical protein